MIHTWNFLFERWSTGTTKSFFSQAHVVCSRNVLSADKTSKRSVLIGRSCHIVQIPCILSWYDITTHILFQVRSGTPWVTQVSRAQPSTHQQWKKVMWVVLSLIWEVPKKIVLRSEIGLVRRVSSSVLLLFFSRRMTTTDSYLLQCSPKWRFTLCATVFG